MPNVDVVPPPFPVLNREPTSGAVLRNFSFGDFTRVIAGGISGGIVGFAGGTPGSSRMNPRTTTNMIAHLRPPGRPSARIHTRPPHRSRTRARAVTTPTHTTPALARPPHSCWHCSPHPPPAPLGCCVSARRFAPASVYPRRRTNPGSPPLCQASRSGGNLPSSSPAWAPASASPPPSRSRCTGSKATANSRLAPIRGRPRSLAQRKKLCASVSAVAGRVLSRRPSRRALVLSCPGSAREARAALN